MLKGDNNSFIDAEHPTEEQIVGSLWVTAPAVGRAAEWLREPMHSALLVGLVTLIALGGGARRGRLAAQGLRNPPGVDRSPAWLHCRVRPAASPRS